jgi:ribose transport system substrate-binding protein
MLRKMLSGIVRPRIAFVACLMLAAGALVLTSCTGGGPSGANSGTKRIVFLINMPDPFWDACKAGFLEGEQHFKLKEAGLVASFESNNGTPQGQIDKLRQFASQPDIVGVAISAIQADNEAIVEELKNLKAKGVHVITVDNDVNRERFRDVRSYYIGTNNFDAGKILGAATKTILEAKKIEKGPYVQFVGDTGADNARARMDGVKAGLTDQYTERDRMPDGGNITKSQDNVRNALSNHDDLVALVGIYAFNGPAISVVVQERKVRDKVAVVTFDAAEGSLEAMEKGYMDAMCVQNPFDMGFQAVRLLKAMYEKDEAVIQEMFPNEGQPDGDIYTTGLRIVAPDEGSPLSADQFDSNVVEFMTLSQMREWLAKYNLKSS